MHTNPIRYVLASLIVTCSPGLALAQAPAETAPPAAAPPAETAPAPSPARSLTETAPASPRATPRWSFGAGIAAYGTSTIYPIGSTLSSSLGFLGAGYWVPALGASLERRVGARSWLVLGFDGSLSRNRQDVAPGSQGMTRDDYGQLTVSAGVRRTLTRAAAPVEVSAIVLAQGGILDSERRSENRFDPALPTETREDATLWFAGAQAGIAVERELTDGLSLRVASPLLAGRYERGTVRRPGGPSLGSSAVNVFALLAPRLELRLLF